MNALQMAKTAYTASHTPIRTARGSEYEAFARITHQLKSAAEKGSGAYGQLVAALHDNRQLWTILATDVAETGNQLPQALRAQVFYLAEFTQQHSREVLADRADIAVLIDINTAMMRGLRQAADAP